MRTLLFCLGILSLSAEELNHLVLVTGCGRSGTTYISKVFTRAGYEMKHEKGIGSFGLASWYRLFEADRKFAFSVVLHQIRNPLDAIASIQTFNWVSFEFIRRRLTQYDPEAPLLTRAATYWLYWNQEAEARADYSYPLEHLQDHLEAINQLTGCNLQAHHLGQVPSNTNTRPHNALTWEDLKQGLPPPLFEELCTYTKKWGYDCPYSF